MEDWGPNLMFREGIIAHNQGKHRDCCPVNHEKAIIAFQRGWDKARRVKLFWECRQDQEERVKLVGFAGLWDGVKKFLTPQEEKEIAALWQTMPGTTCWMDAFFRWFGGTIKELGGA